MVTYYLWYGIIPRRGLEVPRHGNRNWFGYKHLRLHMVQVSYRPASKYNQEVVHHWYPSRSENYWECSASRSVFPSIPLTRVVADNLHMFLRVSDVLIDLLITELHTLDKINQATKLKSLDNLTHPTTIEKSVKELGISGFSFWIRRESRKLKWRIFTGPEKLKILSSRDLISLSRDREYW